MLSVEYRSIKTFFKLLKLHSITKKRRNKKEMSYSIEISYAKTFGPNMQMIKIWCPANEWRELHGVGTAHSAGADKDLFSIS